MIIRLADCPSQPWKNGLGRTREIAVQPSLAGTGDFLWRVSIADVESAAPFSRFPGIDRHIALLEGAGFTMTLDDRDVHALTTPFAPFAFPGEAKVDVALAGGPTRDFNVMVRRSMAHADVQVWDRPVARLPDPATVMVFCARGSIDTVDGRLDAGDAWRASSRPVAPVTLHDGALALVVRIEPRAA